MPTDSSGVKVTTVEVLKQNWSEAQIAAALAHHDLPEGSNLTPDHFAAAGITEPENGVEHHTFTLTEGPTI